MRFLLLKDLRILRRSPLLVGGLIAYPLVIALLIGLALSRGPDKPRVAFVSEAPPGPESQVSLGRQRVDVSQYANRLFSAIDRVPARNREEALAAVRSGRALAALIVPADAAAKLSSQTERPTLEVAYNAEDPVKARFVQATIRAQLADANSALSKKLAGVAVQYVDLLLRGGRFDALGTPVNILGLQRANAILKAEQTRLPRGSPDRAALQQVIDFASLAIDNAGFSNPLLTSLAEPVAVHQTVVSGRRTPLDAFAVAVALCISLMFVGVLLAAGMLALEREENAFGRLVRGLVSRSGLVAEKAGLAALCAFAASLLMLVGIGLFVGLAWGRMGLAAIALGVAALAFGALGVAVGGLAREVRAASLLAFVVTLPMAFLALVPSGAVSSGLFDVVRVVSAVFPFKPALQAVNSGLNGGEPGLLGPLLHLLALILVFGGVGRLALRRLG